MTYEYKNKKGVKYYLHTTSFVLKGSNKKQTIYYFAKKTGQGAMSEIPKGYKLLESKRSGLPVLKKIR